MPSKPIAAKEPAHGALQSAGRQNASEMLRARRRSERAAFIEALKNPSLLPLLQDNEVFATLVDLAINDYGLSQNELARAVRVHPSAVTRWSAGDSAPRGYARPIVVATIAELLARSLDQVEEIVVRVPLQPPVVRAPKR